MPSLRHKTVSMWLETWKRLMQIRIREQRSNTEILDDALREYEERYHREDEE